MLVSSRALLLRRFGVFFGGLCLLLVVNGSVNAAETKPLNVGFTGYPLQYERTMHYHKDYPEIEGMYVDRMADSAPAVLAGLREGATIQSVNGVRVQTLAGVRSVFERNLGYTVTMTVYQTTARSRIEHQQHRSSVGATDAPDFTRQILRVKQPPPRPVELTVVAGPGRHLYHRTTLKHSPDPRNHDTYPRPKKARKDQLQPCPVCFPGQEPSVAGKVLRSQLKTSQQLDGLINRYQRIDPPPELKQVSRRLFRLRLREDVEPSLVVLETAQPFAFAQRDGRIVLSQGILTLTETEPELAFTVARLLGHVDLRHNPTPVNMHRFRSLFEEAVQRGLGVNFTFEQMVDWSPQIPGFSYYRDILDKGYDNEQEREATFMGMVYLYRAENSFDGVDVWRQKSRDIANGVHPHWVNYILRHPLPGRLEGDIRIWKKRIPQRFSTRERQTVQTSSNR